MQPKTLQPKTKNPTSGNLLARLSVCQVVFNVGQQIFAAADCRPNKMPNPIMPEELACSMCFIVKQQSLDIISDVPEGAVRDHFVIKRHHNGRAAEAVVALVLGVTVSWICLSCMGLCNEIGPVTVVLEHVLQELDDLDPLLHGIGDSMLILMIWVSEALRQQVPHFLRVFFQDMAIRHGRWPKTKDQRPWPPRTKD